MSSPSAGSQWQAGATLVAQGTITWVVDTTNFIMEPRPDSCIVYIHAGGASGTVTNSGNATISSIMNPTPPVTVGSEAYSASLTLTPTNPPISGGNGKFATFFIEAQAFFNGSPIYVNGQVLNVMNTIAVRNG